MEFELQYLSWFIGAPFFTVIIFAEIIISRLYDLKLYTTKETATNVYLMFSQMAVDFAFKFVSLAALAWCFSVKFIALETTWYYWIILILLVDLAYYALHWLDHNCRLFWAIHVTHHSSNEFNITTGFRSSVFQPLYRFVFFLPLAFLGFNPIDILFVYAIGQMYGNLVHTQHPKRWGWLEYVLVTPSHHRVHHASNIPFLDKNIGMVFIFWDRLFGTFADEKLIEGKEQLKYGLTKPIARPNHPVDVVFHEWHDLIQDLKKPAPLSTKINYLFKAPGWSPDGSSKTSKQLQEEWYERYKDELPVNVQYSQSARV